jgi:opacity protein-like surface antigen
LPDSPKRLLHFQLALVYGESGGLQGMAVSSVALRTRHNVEGLLAAPGVTLVGGNLRGVVATAGYAQVDGVLEGVVSGVAAAWHRGKLGRGVVVAAGGAIAGELTGVVAAAGFASAKSLTGVAAAAGATVTRGPSEGVLAAGGVNFSAAHRGVEVAGGFNTARELEGLAIAPVNFHRKVKGLQLGVVNVAEEVDGAAIGVISVAKNGRLQPVLWGTKDRSLHFAIKSIVGFAFTQLGAGINVGADTFSYDAGAGMHFKLSQHVFLEPGVHYSSSQSTKDASGAPDEHRLYYLAHAGYRVGDKIDLLVGAGVRHTVSGGEGNKVGPELRAGIGFF